MRSGPVLHHPRRSAPRGRARARPAPATPSPARAPRLSGPLGVPRRQPFPSPPRAPSLSVDTSRGFSLPARKTSFAFLSLRFPLCEMGENVFPSQDGAEEKKSKDSVPGAARSAGTSHRCVLKPLENPWRQEAPVFPFVLRCSSRPRCGKAAQELAKTRLIGADSGSKGPVECPGEA